MGIQTFFKLLLLLLEFPEPGHDLVVGWKVASGIGPNLFQALFFYLMNLTFWKMPKYSTHWKVTYGMLPNHFHYWNATFWMLPKYVRRSWEHKIVGTETSFEQAHKLNTKHSDSY